jgi:hypothetical protein
VLAAINPTPTFSEPTRFHEEVLRDRTRIRRALRGTLHTVRAKPPQLQLAGTGVHVIAMAAPLA